MGGTGSLFTPAVGVVEKTGQPPTLQRRFAGWPNTAIARWSWCRARPMRKLSAKPQAALQSQSVPTLPALPALSLAGVLSNCAALLGNDSGISHLAAAVGTPTAALFGPTRRRVWRPLGSHVHALRFESIQPERVGKLLLSVRKSALSPYLVWKSHAAQTDGKIS